MSIIECNPVSSLSAFLWWLQMSPLPPAMWGNNLDKITLFVCRGLVTAFRVVFQSLRQAEPKTATQSFLSFSWLRRFFTLFMFSGFQRFSGLAIINHRTVLWNKRDQVSEPFSLFDRRQVEMRKHDLIWKVRFVQLLRDALLGTHTVLYSLSIKNTYTEPKVRFPHSFCQFDCKVKGQSFFNHLPRFSEARRTHLPKLTMPNALGTGQTGHKDSAPPTASAWKGVLKATVLQAPLWSIGRSTLRRIPQSNSDLFCLFKPRVQVWRSLSSELPFFFF